MACISAIESEQRGVNHHGLGERRNIRAIRPLLLLPQLCSDDALRTMHECLFDGNDQNKVGGLPIHRQPALQCAVADDLTSTADPQGVAISWDYKEQSDLGMDKQVLERI